MMSPFNARTGVSLLFLALTAISATPASAGKFVKPGDAVKPTGKELQPTDPVPQPPPPPKTTGKLDHGGVMLPPTGGVLLPNEPSTPAPPPEPKGWPHSIITGSSANCARNPGPTEVIVFRDGNFTGSCAVLTPGFYPFAANFLVGNDAITGIKVGSAVRARIYKDPVYAGDWKTYAPGTQTAGIGSFNDKISSMRVEPANRSQNCDDLREGEIALFENSWLAGDCVVLPGEGSYANAEAMGIENDSISSIRNNSARTMQVYWHPSFNLGAIQIPPHSRKDTLPEGGWFTNGINDDISSIQMLAP
jgi:hypothetical protein